MKQTAGISYNYRDRLYNILFLSHHHFPALLPSSILCLLAVMLSILLAITSLPPYLSALLPQPRSPLPS